MTHTLWFLCGILAAIILLIGDRESLRGADFFFFTMVSLCAFCVVILGPVSLAVITAALFLKFIFDR